MKLFGFLVVSLTMTACSDEAGKLKKQALEACEVSAQQMPENMREETLKVCQCTVEKTDYQAAVAGDAAKLQADAIKNAEACAKELGSM